MDTTLALTIIGSLLTIIQPVPIYLQLLKKNRGNN